MFFNRAGGIRDRGIRDQGSGISNQPGNFLFRLLLAPVLHRTCTMQDWCRNDAVLLVPVWVLMLVPVKDLDVRYSSGAEAQDEPFVVQCLQHAVNVDIIIWECPGLDLLRPVLETTQPIGL